MPDRSEYSFPRAVWKRFRRSPGAMFGLAVIVLLCLAALGAPLLANGLPLLVKCRGIYSSPAFRALLAPDSTEIFVAKTFNFLLLFLPVLGMLKLGLRRRKTTFRILAGLAALALLIPFCRSGMYVNVTDWRAAAQKMSRGDYVLFAPVPFGPYETAAQPYSSPDRRHWFGTDHAGRDVFARMVYGARVSLAVGFFATSIAMLLGACIGLLAGYRGGATDLVIMRLVEIVICFPTFLLLLILMSILLDYGSRQSILLVIAVIGLTGWTGLCRLVRGETLRVRQNDYIRSCEVMGAPLRRILFVHLLPNVSGPVFVSFTFEVAGAILAESSLSFLGFGVQDPTASWGELLRQAFPDPLTYWHLMLWPGLAIFLAVCSFNLVGEGLRKALNAAE